LIAGATSAQQLIITGTGFNSSTTVTLGNNPPLTGTANAAGTSITISVPASDLTTANAGNLPIKVSNPGAAAGSSTLTFPLVAITGVQDASTSGTIMVNAAGTPAMVRIDYLTNPANAPLPAALTVACALPQTLTGATCTVNGGTIAAGAVSGSSTITINAIPTPGAALGSSPSAPGMGERGPWSTYLLWSVIAALLAMLGMLGAVRQRALPLRRVPMYLTLGLLMLAAGGLVGCTTAQKTPTPTGPSTLTVTATTADGATVTTTVNINVSN
jgi:hypothetical protein